MSRLVTPRGQSPHILLMPSLDTSRRRGTNPWKNTTNTSYNELLQQEPLVTTTRNSQSSQLRAQGLEAFASSRRFSSRLRRAVATATRFLGLAAILVTRNADAIGITLLAAYLHRDAAVLIPSPRNCSQLPSSLLTTPVAPELLMVNHLPGRKRGQDYSNNPPQNKLQTPPACVRPRMSPDPTPNPRCFAKL